MYDTVPPLTIRLIEPVLLPLQRTLVAVADALNAVGSVTAALEVLMHPTASVIVTVYVPAHNPVTVDEVAPLLHEYVKGEVPPDIVTSAEPLHTPLHDILAVVKAVAVPPDWLFMVVLTVAVHPLASVTVTK